MNSVICISKQTNDITSEKRVTIQNRFMLKVNFTGLHLFKSIKKEMTN